MTDLKTCPFCGGEARFETYGGTACAVVCQTCGCGTPTMRLDDGMIAADLWNRRAERTCRIEVERRKLSKTQTSVIKSCSECGVLFGVEEEDSFPFEMTLDKVDPPNYCPNCGAKVVSGDADR